jgi:two-component system NarL family sensor kinase
MVYRIVQELINNALKHANANHIHVVVNASHTLEISVSDNGIGFDPQKDKELNEHGNGLGLFNIENRARLINAKVEYSKNRPTGTKANITIPYEKI